MNPSSNFHTGSVVLLTATVVCGALGLTLVAPMLQRDSFAQTRIVPSEKTEPVELADTKKFSEFYPTIEDGRRELKRLEAAAGPIPPPIREARIASDSSPQQLPAGTVYAPVTVNVDSSALAAQMSQMSTRFEELIVQRNQETTAATTAVAAEAAAETAKQKPLARKQRQRNRPALDSESQLQIVRIEAGLQQLAESVNALQSRTKSEMDELELQKSRAAMASQLLETYERTMTARLQNIEDSHAELRTPSRVAQVPQQTYSDGVPFPQEALASKFSEPVPEKVWEVQPQAMPELKHRPKTALEPHPKPKSLTAEPSTAKPKVNPVPLLDFEVPPTPRLLPMPIMIEPSLPAPQSEVVPEPSIEIWPQDASLQEPILERNDSTPPPTAAVPPREPLTFYAIPIESPPPIPETTLLEVTPPATAPPVVLEVPALPSVGYEHVYRFKLSDVESESAPTVVPGDGPVCQHCGLIHVPGEEHAHRHLELPPGQPRKIQTVSNSDAETATPRPESSIAVASVQQDANRTGNRTAGRGYNRHVQNARHSESERPVWDVDRPSFGTPTENAESTADTERTSLMQRVSATLKQLTR